MDGYSGWEGRSGRFLLYYWHFHLIGFTLYTFLLLICYFLAFTAVQQEEKSTQLASDSINPKYRSRFSPTRPYTLFPSVANPCTLIILENVSVVDRKADVATLYFVYRFSRFEFQPGVSCLGG